MGNYNSGLSNPTSPKRPMVALIDAENIDWSLGRLVGRENLSPETRVDYGLLAEYVCTQTGSEQDALLLAFLQDSWGSQLFARHLGELGYQPFLFERESDPTQRYGRRPVVDEAIYLVLDELHNRYCDVLLVTNDGGYLPRLEELRRSGRDGARQYFVAGLIHEMSGEYLRADWVHAMDLERDVQAFRRPLPPRPIASLVDEFNADAALGDFGLYQPDDPPEAA